MSLFTSILLHLLAALSVLYIHAVFREKGIRLFHSLLNVLKEKTLSERIFLNVFFLAMVGVICAKPGGNTNGTSYNLPRPSAGDTSPSLTPEDFARGFVLTRIGTNEAHDFSPSGNAVVNSNWLMFGAAEDWTYLSFDDWAFPFVSNEVNKLRVCSFGKVSPFPLSANVFFAPFLTSLGIVPEVNWSRIVFNAEAQSRGDTQSCFWHCLTPSNTLLLTWQNALYNRATNTPVSIQVEISPEGSFVYRYDLSSIRMKIQSGEWPENWASNIAIGASNEGNGQVLGAKIASSNLCETLRLCDSALKNGTLTSLAFQRLEADDSSGSDRDNDGLTIEDEIFVYHTNPNCRDSDFDGISDGEEVALGTNPTSRDSDGDGLVDGSDPDPGTQTSLADQDADEIPDAYENHWFGGTNETDIVDNRDETGFTLATKIKCGINPLDSISGEYVVLTNVLSSRKLFDAFSLNSSGGETNLLFERTFAINRTTPWQQYFLSSSPSGAAPWCMEGAFLEWETSGGVSGVVSKSPYNDTFRIPLATNDFSSLITIRVRSLCNTSVRVPNPIHLLAFTPKITIEGGKILRGESGKVFSAFFDGSQSAIKLKIDRTLRPSSSPVAPDENDMVTLNAMSGSDKDFTFAPTDNGGTIAVVRPGVYAMPSLPFFDNVAALVVLQPSVSWKCNRHGCSFDGVDYDWNRHGYIEENPYPLDSSCLRKKWYRTWDGGWSHDGCTLKVASGVGEDNELVTVENDGEKTGFVYVDGVLAWSKSSEHFYDGESCGGYRESISNNECDTCESDCSNGNCDALEGASLGSLNFRIPLGSPVKGHVSGFVWFSADGPFWVSPSIFNLLKHPSAEVAETAGSSSRTFAGKDARSRDISICEANNGVEITVRESQSKKLEHIWEIFNVDGDHSRIRLRKISRLGNVMSDETFTFENGDWTRFDNIALVSTSLYVDNSIEGVKREVRTTADANGSFLGTIETEQTRIGECDSAVLRETYRCEMTGWNSVWTIANYWNEPSSARHGMLQLLSGNARAWEYFDYDEEGRETLHVKMRGNADIPTSFPYVVSNNLYDVDSLENAFVTVKDYEPFEGDSKHPDDIAKTRQETDYVAANGNVTIIGRTWKRYTRLNRNGYSAIKEETWRAFSPSATRDAESNAYSYEITFAATGVGTPLLMRDAVAESLDENGILTVNTYSLDGDILRTVTRKSFNGVPYQTYSVTELDSTYGNQLRKAEYLTATDTLIGNEVSAYDEKNRLRSTVYFDGTFITNAYSCCRLLWRQDREGRKTLRSAKTGTDYLYNAEEDVWVEGIGKREEGRGDGEEGSGFRVTQHFFDGLGRETNTVVCVGMVPGEAVEASASNGKVYSSAKTEYPYGGSDYAVSIDERGKETISSRDVYYDSIVFEKTVYTNDIEVVRTRSCTYYGGGSQQYRAWDDGKWTTEHRFTDYDEDGKRIEYVVTESSDYGIVTNSVSTYDLLDRLVTSVVSGVNGSVITTTCTYDGTTGRKLTELTTGSPAISYEYDAYGNLSATIQDGKSIRNTTTYETIDGEIYRVSTRIGMTGDVTNSVQYRKQRLTGLSNELRSKIISLASSGRVTVNESSFNAETGCLTEISQTEDETPITIVSRYGLPQEQVTIDGRSVISYDALGREAEARFYDVGDETPNRLEVKEYDISGNVIRIFTDLMDGRNGETLTQYDTLNREVRRMDILGHVTEMRYDALGRMISVGGDTYPLKSGYDTQGRKISGSTTRDNGVTWDETAWEFDSASGVNTAKVYADGTRIAYNYTDNGRKTRTTWARGVWKQNAYNERNLVSGTTYSDSATPSVAYTYSNAGKIESASLSDGTAYSYDYDSRLLNTAENIIIAGDGYSLSLTYDDYRRNVKTSVLHTNVHHAAKTRIYDSESRVCGYVLTNATGRGVAVNVSYIGSYQNRIVYTLPDGNTFTVEYGREASRKHLVTSRRYRYGNQQMYSYSTEYDLLGRPVNATDSLSMARKWLYNNRNELASAVIGTNSYAYAYDSIGNREWAALNSATNSYTVNSLNQYSQLDASQFAHDADGNLTQDGRYNYTYDAENRLVSIVPIAPTEGSLSIDNRYDHKGLRIGKTVKRFENGYWKSHATHTFIFDGGNIVLERIAKADGNQVIKEYFWEMDKSGTEQGAGGVGGLLAVSVNGVFSIPCYDHNGNIVAYVSETGGIESLYVYDAYGNTIEKSGEKADVHSFGFSTKYHDREVGVVGYQKRFYCPDLGRWLNRDPIEEEGGENLYRFCGNNSVATYDIQGNYPSDNVDKLKNQIGQYVEKIKTALRGLQECLQTVNAWRPGGKRDSMADDKYRHCVASCKIANTCGGKIAIVLGLLKELRDVTFGIPQAVANKIGGLYAESLFEEILEGGSLEDSLNDLTADVMGIDLKNAKGGCECACKQYYKP